MMKKTISYAFVAFFALQGLLFFIRQPGETVLTAENRAIKQLPEKIRFTTNGIKDFFREIDGYFIDRVLFRERILKALGDYAVGDVGDLDKAIIGKDGWLFLGNIHEKTLDKLSGAADRKTRAGSEKFVRALIAKAGQLENVFILVGPNKSTIYPEYLPGFITPSGERYSQGYLDELRRAGLAVFDPTEVMLAAKNGGGGYLYYSTDSHWNLFGGGVAYSAFLDYLKPRFPGLTAPAYELAHNAPFKGDLMPMLNIRKHSGRNDDSFKLSFIGGQGEVLKRDSSGETQAIPYDAPLDTPKPGEPISVTNPNSVSTLRLWLFRDSFAIALSPYLHATFRETVHFHPADFFTINGADENRPDLIVFERVERVF